MVRNGHNVSICIWYEMVIMYRSAYGTKWQWYEMVMVWKCFSLWYEMTVIPINVLEASRGTIFEPAELHALWIISIYCNNIGWTHPVAMLLLYYYKEKNAGKTGHAQNILPVRAISRQGLFRSRDFDTSGQKAPLGWILRNFRLRMRRTYFRTWHVTDVTSGLVTGVISGHVTSGSSSSLLRKY